MTDPLARAAFAWSVRLISGCGARWIGIDPLHPETGQPVQRVYFANHTSNLDAPVIWAALPSQLRYNTRPIAAQDYWDKGAVRQFLAKRILNAVLIERLKVTRSSHPLVPMEAALATGSSLIIFPEGTRGRNESGELGEFKPGLFHLARKFPGVQFVPVYLDNLSRILPKGEILLVPILAAARFGAPVQLGEGEAKTDYLVRAREALAALGREQTV
jgi:1-acyl-sn-glycerol-3-phosphate acyltransferase